VLKSLCNLLNVYLTLVLWKYASQKASGAQRSR
jgi:hypothetical protein